MPISVRDTRSYRKDEKLQHEFLTDEEKRRIMKVRNRLSIP